LISSLIAGVWAWKDKSLDLGAFALVTIGLTFAHATHNLLNDVVDWYRGVDKDNYFRNQYGSHPQILMTQLELFNYFFFTASVSFMVALLLCLLRGQIVVYLTLLGAFFLLFYTYPLKWIALGELSVFLVWGVLMVGGGYYAIAAKWSWEVVLVSVPYALGVTTVIMGKHIDKLNQDRQKGIYTLPVLLGQTNAAYLLQTLILAQYLVFLYLIGSGVLHPSSLIFLVLAAGYALWNRIHEVFLAPKPETCPPNHASSWPLWYVAYAFDHNRSFGILYLLALVATASLRVARGK